MKILLMGYMGSGKSTVGKRLAEILKFDFIDLDAFIEQNENQSIVNLFKAKGEIYFRKKESLYLNEILLKKNVVISLGGGTPCYGTNMNRILTSENARSVYLKLSIPSLVSRLNDETTKRPLIAHLKTDEELVEFIGKHLFERSPFYNRADLTVSADYKTVDELTEEIVANLF
ncbi:shikimate kinase [Subsaxibacter sp. CAU 1640]|uniref:shikimate kinase n=1 Tax=Subsaxibacter sp. CAU 1640 TaxID=2933271 RepID=UPI002005029D|nr:shikimate kinase [Subsaxibacter sp. CAU 1640]MCK7589845.1 shikimate kinase [Subsaxibacter sp. CAU 1640]